MSYDYQGKPIRGDFLDNIDIDYAYDSATGANYTVVRIYKTKADGSKQYPFVYAPNGASAGTKSTLEMVEDDGFAFAINGGLFNTNTKVPEGIIIQNGIAVKSSLPTARNDVYPLTINSDGNLGYANPDASASALVNSGIVSALCGFCPIIIDYDDADDAITLPSVDHFSENAQRQIIGQFGNGDYAIVTCEGRGYDNSDGWTIEEAQAVCKKLGLKFAYNLDGGGSTETMLGLKPINTIYERTKGRIVPTFIVFNGSSIFSIPNS